MAAFSQLPYPYDLEFVQGDDVSFSILIKEGSPAVVKNLTGYTFVAVIATSAGPMAIAVACPLPLTGVVTFTLTAAQTATLKGDYDWEFDWIDVSTKRRTLILGTAKVSAKRRSNG